MDSGSEDLLHDDDEETCTRDDSSADVNTSVYGEQIYKILHDATLPASVFSCAKSFPQSHPGIIVDGFGELPLPLCESVVKQVVAQVAAKSPFGKGEKTVYDDNVRKSWELQPSQFAITNPLWNPALSHTIENIKAEFGMQECYVGANLHKLLIYQPGDHFKAHRDTEKEDGMFGTLILQLPSTYTGGDCTVQFQDEKEVYTFGGEQTRRFAASYLAFFADCLHEIRPVESGYRCVLVYNLINKSTSNKVVATASNCLPDREKIVKLLSDWNYADDSESPMLVFITDHLYTKKNLNFKYLKGKDRGVAQLLGSAVENSNLDIRLSLGIIELKDFNSHLLEKRSADLGGDDDDDNLRSSQLYLVKTRYITQKMKYCCEDELGVLDPLNSSLLESRELENETARIDSAYVHPNKSATKRLRANLRDETEGDTGNEGVEITRWYRVTCFVVTSMDRFLRSSAFSYPSATVAPLLSRYNYERAHAEFDKTPATTTAMIASNLKGAFKSGESAAIAKSLELLFATQQGDLLAQNERELTKRNLNSPLPKDLIAEMKMHLFPWDLIPNSLVAELMRVYSWNEILFPFFRKWVRKGGGIAGLAVFQSVVSACDSYQQTALLEIVLNRFSALPQPKSSYWGERLFLPLTEMVHAIASVRSDSETLRNRLAIVWAKLDALIEFKKNDKVRYRREPDDADPKPDVLLINHLSQMCDVEYCRQLLEPLTKHWTALQMLPLFEWTALNGTPQAESLLNHLAEIEIVKIKALAAMKKDARQTGFDFLCRLGLADGSLRLKAFDELFPIIKLPTRERFVCLYRARIDPAVLESSLASRLETRKEEYLMTLMVRKTEVADEASLLYLRTLFHACCTKITADFLKGCIDANSQTIAVFPNFLQHFLACAYVFGLKALSIVLPLATAYLPATKVLEVLKKIDKWSAEYEQLMGKRPNNKENFTIIVSAFVGEYEKRLQSAEPQLLKTFSLPALTCDCVACEPFNNWLEGDLCSEKFNVLVGKLEHVSHLIVENGFVAIKKTKTQWLTCEMLLEKNVYSRTLDTEELKKIRDALLALLQPQSELPTNDAGDPERMDVEGQQQAHAPHADEPGKNNKRDANSLGPMEIEHAQGDEKKLKLSS